MAGAALEMDLDRFLPVELDPALGEDAEVVDTVVQQCQEIIDGART